VIEEPRYDVGDMLWSTDHDQNCIIKYYEGYDNLHHLLVYNVFLEEGRHTCVYEHNLEPPQ